MRKPNEKNRDIEFHTSLIDPGSIVSVRPDVVVSNYTPAKLTVGVARNKRDHHTTVEIHMIVKDAW